MGAWISLAYMLDWRGPRTRICLEPRSAKQAVARNREVFKKRSGGSCTRIVWNHQVKQKAVVLNGMLMFWNRTLILKSVHEDRACNRQTVHSRCDSNTITATCLLAILEALSSILTGIARNVELNDSPATICRGAGKLGRSSYRTFG